MVDVSPLYNLVRSLGGFVVGYAKIGRYLGRGHVGEKGRPARLLGTPPLSLKLSIEPLGPPRPPFDVATALAVAVASLLL